MIDLLRGLTFLAYWLTLGALIIGVLIGAEKLGNWFHNYQIKNPAERANATTGLNNDSEI